MVMAGGKVQVVMSCSHPFLLPFS